MGKKFWAEAAMLGTLAATGGQELDAQQQKDTQKNEQPAQKESEQSTKEKTDNYLNLEDSVKKENKIEEDDFKNYIQTSKGSKEEKDLFNKLYENNNHFRGNVMKLMRFTTDSNSAIRSEAMKLWLELNKSIQARKKECRDAGKDYFDRIPAPPALPKMD